MSNKIVVLGGDGFCGWPVALRLSKEGNRVTIVDNLSRRGIDGILSSNSITPIRTIEERLEKWNSINDVPINFINIDLSKNRTKLENVFYEINPDTIVHFAEQRAAPYSMRNDDTNEYTVFNNIIGTNNVLIAMKNSCPKAHLIHLGTMGVYGYDFNSKELLPEGYLDIEYKDNNENKFKRKIVYPSTPGSIYHLTKVTDNNFFQFYSKNFGINITDLHQGIVWGTNTKETLMAEELVNRFDYDGEYGTVLNRFVVQSAIGFPMTVHGSGGQTRAFIHISDTVKCILLSVKNPNKSSDVRIINQQAETKSIIEIAKIVEMEFGGNINFVCNPRQEKDTNTLEVENNSLCNMGWNPIKIDAKLLEKEFQLVKSNIQNINKNRIEAMSTWNEKCKPGVVK
jgi:UDP-sulfoquinovose synthase